LVNGYVVIFANKTAKFQTKATFFVVILNKKVIKHVYPFCRIIKHQNNFSITFKTLKNDEQFQTFKEFQGGVRNLY